MDGLAVNGWRGAMHAFARPAWLLGGYLVWSVSFLALYAVHGVGCELAGDHAAALRAALVAVWVAGVAAGVALLLARPGRAGGDRPAFASRVAFALAATGTLATAWTGLPIVLADPCRPPSLTVAPGATSWPEPESAVEPVGAARGAAGD